MQLEGAPALRRQGANSLWSGNPGSRKEGDCKQALIEGLTEKEEQGHEIL